LTPESNIFEKTDPESLFNLSSNTSLCGHLLSKIMGKFRVDQWQPESEQKLDSQIWKISRTGSGFKNFGTKAQSESYNVTPA